MESEFTTYYMKSQEIYLLTWIPFLNKPKIQLRVIHARRLNYGYFTQRTPEYSTETVPNCIELKTPSSCAFATRTGL